ncbi:MAG TPA: DUF438 domain-containing protein [Candidatus Aminicenantes bacterium]|nr:DUF438 domain-containing protein [Candidatus Aminicenantes bacterium]HOS11821.1 DUF438 domain-containing protein [Candidatus Aminicenantes bacterium]HPL14256.1 DUF438 domain-containing protein [Candidatus Aminicenantes bacterium]
MPKTSDSTRNERQEALKGIIKDLHAGATVKDLRKRFAVLIKDTSAEEIADMENALIQEGFPVEEIQRLCEVHAEVFDKSLRKAGKPSKIPGHPVHTYLEENREARRRLKDMKRALKKIKENRPGDREIEAFRERFEAFREFEKHYARKENQLFPPLEATGFTGPTKVMWGKHDEIRAHLKSAADLLAAGDWAGLKERFGTLASAVKKMMFLEERILFPTSARKLKTSDWVRIKNGEPAIGYAWIKPSAVWDARLAETMSAPAAEPAPSAPAAPSRGAEKLSAGGEGPAASGIGPALETIRLSQGRLTPEQIDLMLRRLPVDITFVDENDRVAYYSDGPERIFPRSPEVIGRKVQNCHPPKSVHIVNEIVQAFKEGTKDVAEFWIQREGGPFIHIRYFAVRDEAGSYRGTIEVSQDIAPLRALQGERRLLNWEML